MLCLPAGDDAVSVSGGCGGGDVVRHSQPASQPSSQADKPDKPWCHRHPNDLDTRDGFGIYSEPPSQAKRAFSLGTWKAEKEVEGGWKTREKREDKTRMGQGRGAEKKEGEKIYPTHSDNNTS